MQDPKISDGGAEVGGAPPSASAETVSQMEETSPATVEAEAPSLGGDAVAAAVEVTPAEEQAAKEKAAEARAADESATEEVPANSAPIDVAAMPSDVPGATVETVAEDMPTKEATTEEPSTDASAVAESEAAADEEPSAATAVDAAVAMTEEPAASTAHLPADDATDQAADDAAEVADESVAEGADEPPAEGHDDDPGQATVPILAETIETPDGGGKEGVSDVSELTPAEPPEAPADEETEGVAEAAVTEARFAEQTVADEGAAGDGAAAETDEAAEIDEAAGGGAERTQIDAEDLADTPTDAAEFVGHTIPPTDLEEATGTTEERAATPAFVESVSDTVDAKGTEVAPPTEEEAAEAAGVNEDSEPAGSAVAVAEPAATYRPQTHGVWSDEQVEAFRARLREATATFVDKAAGAVIGTINTVAVAIRARNRRTIRHDGRN